MSCGVFQCVNMPPFADRSSGSRSLELRPQRFPSARKTTFGAAAAASPRLESRGAAAENWRGVRGWQRVQIGDAGQSLDSYEATTEVDLWEEGGRSTIATWWRFGKIILVNDKILVYLLVFSI